MEGYGLSARAQRLAAAADRNCAPMIDSCLLSNSKLYIVIWVPESKPVSVLREEEVVQK